MMLRPARPNSAVALPMTRYLRVSTLLVLLFAAVPAQAQSTEDNSVFDFSLPGARSRALAGAFVAIADDATSVYSNPAGLTGLFRPEVSLELRHWRLTSGVIDSGHAFGPASNVGIDTVNGARDREWESSLNGVSFVSFAYPRRRWAVGVFSHQLARYKRDRQTNGAFFNCQGGYRGDNPTPPFCEQSQLDGIDRLFPATQTFDLGIRSGGVAAAFDAPWKLSVGMALQVFHFTLDAVNTVYAARGADKFAPPNRSPQNVELVGTQSGSDVAVGVNAGVLWRPTEKWSAAATFRQGPQFHYHVKTTTGPATLSVPGETFVDDPQTPFRVPDTWALGVAYRPTDYWRIGFEYDRVRYTQLFEHVKNTATRANDPEGLLAVERLTIDDSHQLRVGAEYSVHILAGRLLSLRGGFWHDPLHLPYYRVDDPATGYPSPQWALLFPKREGESHVSGGIGFATQRHLQFEVAFDHAKSVGTFAASAIYRF
jgi:long-chain fatty acid transport protein